MIEDVASGVNEDRRGLKELFKLARKGEIDVVVVEYRDQLTRFSFEYLREALAQQGGMCFEQRSCDRSKKFEC